MFGSPNDTNTTKKRKVIVPNSSSNTDNATTTNDGNIITTTTNTTTTNTNRFGTGIPGYSSSSNSSSYYTGFSPPGGGGNGSSSIGSTLSFSPTTTTTGGDSSSLSSSALFRRSVVGRRPTTTAPSTTTTTTITATNTTRRIDNTVDSNNNNNNNNPNDDSNKTTKFYKLCTAIRNQRMKELNETLYRRMESLQSQVSNTNPYDRYAFITSSTNEKENDNANDDDNDNYYNVQSPAFLYHTLGTEYLRNLYTIHKLYYCVAPSSVKTGKLGGEIIAMGHDDGNQCGYHITDENKNKKKVVTGQQQNNNNNGGDDDDNDDDDDEEEEKTVPPFVQSNFASIPIQTSFKGVAAGGLHSVAVTVDGTVYSWGSADDGALGRSSLSERTTTTTTTVKPDMALESEPGLVSRFITKDDSNETGTIIQVVAGDTHILFLSLSGNVYQCGSYKDSDSGKFCIPNPRRLTPQELEEERDGSSSEDDNSTTKKHPIVGCNKRPVHIAAMPGPVQQIFTRGALNAALLHDGTLVTWGFGCKGELARTATMNPVPPPLDGSSSTNNNYDLGKLYMYDFSNPEREQPKYDLILENFLTPKPVLWNDTNIRPKKEVLHVACGSYHLLVTARDGNDPTYRSFVYSSGINNYGQLGHGDLHVDRHELTVIESLATKDIVQVAAGEHHSLVLDYTGTSVYSFGRSDYGQLGIGRQSTGQSQPTPQYVTFPAINKRDTNDKSSDYTNSDNEVPIYPIITQIEAGERHSLAITVDHQIYTWGFNETAPTGHYPNVPDQDINYPTVLNLNNYIGTERAPYCQVYMASGGGHHSLLLCQRYATPGVKEI